MLTSSPRPDCGVGSWRRSRPLHVAEYATSATCKRKPAWDDALTRLVVCQVRPPHGAHTATFAGAAPKAGLSLGSGEARGSRVIHMAQKPIAKERSWSRRGRLAPK